MSSVDMLDKCTSEELASAALVIPSPPDDQPESLDTLGLVGKTSPMNSRFKSFRIYLVGIKAEKYHELFIKNDITADLLPYLTRGDLEDIGIPEIDLDDIFQSIKCLRPANLQEMNQDEEKLFDMYSNNIDKSEGYKLFENNAEHIRYLTGVAQHIKRQVRGFDGKSGILEDTKDEFIITPGEMVAGEVDIITAYIQQMKNQL